MMIDAIINLILFTALIYFVLKSIGLAHQQKMNQISLKYAGERIEKLKMQVNNLLDEKYAGDKNE